ncbi:hypothetical protein [Pleionea sp. CnH1-48]|uniref:phage fiber-tail adaptor protein n=1 Tax=Pleionea sp. CnH1-48 TaxID=2954494 RepID=UPI0020970FC7|nr:hypothetical protein [Pleionea sp. CnH1-48]MCO7225917.1 hypothetical protein [Pleionea sp. CnH1-48]
MIVEKDIDESKVYTLDWSNELGNDTIEETDFDVGSELKLMNQWHSNTETNVLLEGGAAGNIYPVAAQVSTVAGRVLEKVLFVQVIKK